MTVPVIRVKPVVLVSILDHFQRRVSDQNRVVGTLMGRLSEDGSTVYLNNCFPVSHTETVENVGVNAESHHTMLELFQKVNNQDFIIGWYATGDEINFNSSLLHEFFRSEAKCDKTVHLLVDTQSDVMKGFIGNLMGTEVNPCGISFIELETSLDLEFSRLDRIALDIMRSNANQKGKNFQLSGDEEAFKNCLSHLHQFLMKAASSNEHSPIVDQSLLSLSAFTEGDSKASSELQNILQITKVVRLNVELVDKCLQ